jgi:hypothetical protein
MAGVAAKRLAGKGWLPPELRLAEGTTAETHGPIPLAAE